MKKIFAESPQEEQWRLLMHYTYPSNVEAYLKENNIKKPSNTDELIENISSAISQAKEYFEASKSVSLQISPLLMYYGASNLLCGVANLITGELNKIEAHGMVIDTEEYKERIADIKVHPVNPKEGALSVLSDIFTNNCDIVNSENWTLLELLGSVPDLLEEFLSCYPDGEPFAIPLEVIKKTNQTVEKIDPSFLEEFSNDSIFDPFGRIMEFEKNYLDPQYTEQMNYVILRPKMEHEDIGIYSNSGQKHLQVAYQKNGTLFNPPLEILMFMSLYALGHISRYNPEIWNPFIRKDTSGEKLLIEKFIDYSRRIIPNLALDYIKGQRTIFVNQQQGKVDKSEFMTEEEVKDIVREELRKIIENERIKFS